MIRINLQSTSVRDHVHTGELLVMSYVTNHSSNSTKIVHISVALLFLIIL